MKSDAKAPAAPSELDLEAIISAAGGIDQLVRHMGLTERKGYNRVCTWRSRGAVPASVQIKHRQLFLQLMQRAKDAK